MLLIFTTQKHRKTLPIPPIFHDGKAESPRIHWTGLAILEEYWLSEDIDLRGTFDFPPKDTPRHQPANRTAQKSESPRVDSNSFSSSSSCAPATADQPTITIPHPNLEHNADSPRIQEEVAHQQHNTLVQLPDPVFFEQDFSFSGDDSVMFEDNDLYPGSSGSGYPNEFIESSDPERQRRPWTVEDERKFAETLAKYCHGQGLIS
jgi:hypothetical protein